MNLVTISFVFDPKERRVICGWSLHKAPSSLTRARNLQSTEINKAWKGIFLFWIPSAIQSNILVSSKGNV